MAFDLATQKFISESIHNIGGKTRCKKQLVNPRCRWKENIKMDLGEIVW
jgi:hypothetical protein